MVPEAVHHDHSPEAIAERLADGPGHTYLHDAVLGGIDGAVTTFAIVSGVAGAQLSTGIVLILGVANLIADGFSMAAGNYASTRAEHDDFERLEAIEYQHVDEFPEGEREELRWLFRRKGFEGDELERMVAVISSDRDRWVATMLTEEYGLPHAIRSPLLAGTATMVAFLACGLVPLLPYMLGVPAAFEWSVGTTAVVFVLIGAYKSRWSIRAWWSSSLETLLIGGGAATMAYVIGAFLRTIVDV